MTTGQARAWRGIFLGSAGAVLALTGAVLAWGILPGEAALREAILTTASPGLARVARWLSHGGRWPALVPGTLALLALSREARRRWWLWCAVLILAPLLGEAWQELVGRTRPTGTALGFPSGHATAAATFSVLAIYLVGRARLARRSRLAIQSLAVLGIIAVGLARVVLGAHWPGDVLVGFALGAACAAAAAWWDAARSSRPPVGPTGDVAMRHGIVPIVVLALLMTACTRSSPGPSRPLVVAGFYPLYEFSRQVAGDRADVVSLVPSGVEPHDWEPSPQDVAQVQKATLIVYNGAGFEPWMDRLLKVVPGQGSVVVNTTERVDLIVADLPGHEAHTGDAGDGKRLVDPHVWLDPVLAQAQVEVIRAGLARIDPADASGYADRARAYTDKLTALHAALEDGLGQCARRDVVVSHAAFGYLARRYRLVQVPVMGLAPEAEPSPAALAGLVRFA